MTKSSKSISKGFTLIELVIVIVILGILAAVALPKFLDLTGAAYKATASGIAGALSSASTSNYAAKMTGTSGISVFTCQDVGGLILGGIGSYTIVSAAIAPATTGTPQQCVVTAPNGASATFTAIYTP